MSSKSLPSVFVIESLDPDDEKECRYEGRILADILRLSGKTCEYRYIRTKRELTWAVQLFVASNFRYLHLSCHGCSTAMFTTLDEVPFSELGRILAPALRQRRLFISACSMTNSCLAEAIMPSSGCRSLLGPIKTVTFGDAALLWASFYHLMFKRNRRAMKGADIGPTVQRVATTFGAPLRYFWRLTSSTHDYSSRKVLPKADAVIVARDDHRI